MLPEQTNTHPKTKKNTGSRGLKHIASNIDITCLKSLPLGVHVEDLTLSVVVSGGKVFEKPLFHEHTIL